MTRLTVVPFLLAMFAAVAFMPTNVYQVCAWNAGTLPVEAWRQRSTAAVRKVGQAIRAWFASIWSPRVAFACAAVLIALLVAQHTGSPDGLLLAAGPVSLTPSVKAERAKLLRELKTLKGPDGKFAGNDEDRAAFDAKLARVEEINDLERAESDTLVERDALDPTAPKPAPVGKEKTDRDLGAEAERSRVEGIMAACDAARLPRSFATDLIRSGQQLVDCQSVVFEELGKRDGGHAGPRPGAGPSYDMRIGDDPLVHVRDGIENALLHRVRPKTAGDDKGFELSDKGRQYRGMTILRIAEVYLNQIGVRTTSLSKMKIAGYALGLEQRAPGMHTTSDFANLLADVANKTLRQAYNEAPQTWIPLARRTTLPDFKPVKRLQIGEAPALLEVGEHGEFTFGTIGEGKEQFQLVTYGRRFAITRKALVNDDTDAFSRVPTLFGRSARNLESDTVWKQITDNAAMGDTVALFHATHANLAGAGAVISVTTISAGRAAMRIQKGVDGVTLLNISPRYIVTPAAIETTADQLVSTALLAQQTSNVNVFAGRLQVIAEPRLDANSATAWYLAASPDQIDIIEYAYLEGEEGPMVESRVGWEVDGLEIKCREDFAAKVIDYRGLYKNPGA